VKFLGVEDWGVGRGNHRRLSIALKGAKRGGSAPTTDMEGEGLKLGDSVGRS